MFTRSRLTTRRPRHFRRRHLDVPRPDAGPHDERLGHDQVAAVGGRHRVSYPRGCPDAIRHVRTTKEPVQPVPRFDQLIDLIMEPENKHVKLNVSTRADRGGLTADRLQDSERPGGSFRELLVCSCCRTKSLKLTSSPRSRAFFREFLQC